MAEALKDVLMRADHVKVSFKGKGRKSAVVKAVDDVSFDIYRGETFGVVGESGCGKSTLLKMIIGLDPPTEGHIRIDGREVVKPAIDCGMVFQEARLFIFWRQGFLLWAIWCRIL